MTFPIIGIATKGRNKKQFALRMEYVDGVRRAGGVPVLIPPEEAKLDELLRRIDGLLLPGGGDIDPKRYGGTMHEAIYAIDETRDEAEIALVHRAVETELPVLGICRGAQVINVALGGTLIEHLQEDGGIHHRTSELEPAEHSVQIKPGSHLASIVGELKVSPKSHHHQALRQVADGFEVVARAPDGVIEAVEMPGKRFFIAVQWHPELTAAEDPTQQRIFDAFVAAASRRTGMGTEWRGRDEPKVS